MDGRGRTRRFEGLDWLILAVAAIGALAWSLWMTRDADVPYEDAAMLLRYAEHLAGGEGLAWNPGGPPVDGATDFFYTLAVGGVTAAGFSVEHAARLLDYAAHLVTIGAVYGAIRRLWGAPRWMGAVSIAYLATGPVVGYVAAYFGTPFFAMFAALSWYAASAILVEGPTRGRALAFAFLALAMALTRPDGVVMAAAMVMAVVAANSLRAGGIGAGVRATRDLIGWTAAVFAPLGGAYFAWHWARYGHPMPNPFYVKGHAGDSSFAGSIRQGVKIAGPFLVLLLLAFRSRATAWIGVAGLVPAAIFVAAWGVISQDTNFSGRFQYAILPIALMTWPAAAAPTWQERLLPRIRRVPRMALAGALALSIPLALVAQDRLWAPDTLKSDGRAQMGRTLERFGGGRYTIATTEAGLLPLYSKWRAIDAWGLNDERIAHEGLVSASYLDSKRPAVIMFHAFFTPLTRKHREDGPGAKRYDWDSMVQSLKHYAETRRYVLAAAFAPDSSEAHYYYVRRDLPDRDAIVHAIRSTRYDWFVTGEPIRNVAEPGRQLAGGSG